MKSVVIAKFLKVFSIALFIVIGVLMVAAFLNQNKVSEEHRIRFRSVHLAEELRHSSKDLEAAARAYVVTGDPQYRMEFQDILDKRNGLKPRSDGQFIPFRELLVNEGFTKDELVLLDHAMKRSDDLTKIEVKAMNTSSGIYEDRSGEHSIKKTPDRNAAIQIIYGVNYRREIENIMKPILSFEDRVDSRTYANAEKYEFLQKILLVTIFVLTLILAFALYVGAVMKYSSKDKEY